MVAKPDISIVTPLLNRAAMLPAALASVAAQQFVSVEHLVIDGGSSDGSQDVAKEAGAIVVDAPGSSIYEAINIGVEQARGNIICFLNSDDQLGNDALRAALDVFRAAPSLDLLRGRASTIAEGTLGNGVEPHNPLPATPTLRNVLLDVPNINACFFSAGLFDRVGPFNQAYRISADREWMARAMICGVKAATLDRIVYKYREHSGSLTIGHNKPARMEWVCEHIAFAEAFLRDRRLEPVERAVVRAFHAKEIAHLTSLDLAQGAPLAAAQVLVRGFRSNPSWPLSALAPLASIFARRLRGQG